MAILAKLLVAQRGFIEELQTRIITLEKQGTIQSANFKEGQTGFRLKADGDFEANSATFRGHVEARSGTFNGRIEAEEGIFKGSILSGPLVLVDETPSSNTITYNTGTDAQSIVNTELNRLGITVNPRGVQNWSFSISGIFSNNIISIRFYAGMPAGLYAVFVTPSNGAEYNIARSGSLSGLPGAVSLQGKLSFRYTSGGKTFKLTDLPTQNPSVPGAIWRNGNQLMIS